MAKSNGTRTTAAGPGQVPFDLDAEMAVLGACLIDPAVIGRQAGRLPAAAFYRAEHQRIWKTLLTMDGANTRIDLVTLENQLRKDCGGQSGFDRDIGGADTGRAYLVDLAESVPSAANVDYYANIVLEKYRLRQLVSIGGHLQVEAMTPDAQPAELIERLEAALLKERGAGRSEIEFVDPHAMREEVRKVLAGEVEVGIRTGIASLDGILTGLKPGNYVTLAARPGVGKTALALQIAGYVARFEKVPVAFISLEMGQSELMRRMMVQISQVRGDLLRKPDQLNDNERHALSQVETPQNFHIVEAAGLTPASLRSTVRRLVAEFGVKLVVVDYLGLMSDPAGEKQNRTVAMTNVSRAVKLVAREFGVVILALHALSRLSSNEDREPELHDLRDTSAIEHDSDVVLFLHNKTKWGKGEKRPDNFEVLILVRKHREGPLGKSTVFFDAHKLTFGGNGSDADDHEVISQLEFGDLPPAAADEMDNTDGGTEKVPEVPY